MLFFCVWCSGVKIEQESFFAEMGTRRYRGWALRHVKLVLTMPDAEDWQSHVEMMMAECIPSIRTFA